MSSKRKHITIYDVAHELGVSTTTVSRALRDHFSIGRDTIKRVKKKAKELGYEPNALASNLRKKQTNTIGVIVSYINRPFISSLISGIEAVCSAFNYNVIISQSFDSYEKELQDVATMFNSRVDGLIVSLAAETEKFSHFERFVSADYPLVFADRIALQFETDKVIINNFESAYVATSHLIQQGYTCIGHLAGVQNQYVYRKRLEGYIAALKDNNILYREELVYYSKLNFDDGKKAVRSLTTLKQKPDAIFAANDTSAIGFMRHLEEQGYTIPQDFGVVGFNNDPIATIVKPQLTTIDHPAEEIGKKAAEIVLNKVSGKIKTRIPQIITLQTSLIERGSSARG